MATLRISLFFLMLLAQTVLCEPFRLNGYLYDQDGDPVFPATIQYSQTGQSGVTDKNGYWEIVAAGSSLTESQEAKLVITGEQIEGQTIPLRGLSQANMVLIASRKRWTTCGFTLVSDTCSESQLILQQSIDGDRNNIGNGKSGMIVGMGLGVAIGGYLLSNAAVEATSGLGIVFLPILGMATLTTGGVTIGMGVGYHIGAKKEREERTEIYQKGIEEIQALHNHLRNVK